MTKKTCAIIGSGFGGLASAILLAKQGRDVDVYEKNECLGGRASVFEAEGFRFDMGPSWYLMPDVFASFFESIGEKVEDHLDLVKLDPSYRIFFDDGEIVDIHGDKHRDREAFEKLEPGSKDTFFDYIDKSEYQYHIGMDFCRKNYDSLLDFFSRKVAKEGMKLQVFTSMWKYVRRYFSSEKIQKILQYPLVFLGTSPYDAPALYNIMSHVDFNMGVFYPQGGIYALVQALVKLGKQYGVRYHTHTPVDKLHVENGQIQSFTLGGNGDSAGQKKEADIVVCNADQARAETTLLDLQRQTYPTSYREKKMFAPSGFILYLGIDKPLPELSHHNLLFSKDWEKNFDEIFGKNKQLPDDPSIYICNPSKTDPSVAPDGKENIFVLVPTPNGITITPQQEEEYTKKVLRLVQDYTKVSIEQKDILYKRLFHVKDFAERYNARNGTALGLSHSLMQTAVFRPNNISKKVKNLFYVGHNTNPGIGMPMVMISAQLVAERIKKRFG